MAQQDLSKFPSHSFSSLQKASLFNIYCNKLTYDTENWLESEILWVKTINWGTPPITVNKTTLLQIKIYFMTPVKKKLWSIKQKLKLPDISSLGQPWQVGGSRTWQSWPPAPPGIPPDLQPPETVNYRLVFIANLISKLEKCCHFIDVF